MSEKIEIVIVDESVDGSQPNSTAPSNVPPSQPNSGGSTTPPGTTPSGATPPRPTPASPPSSGTPGSAPPSPTPPNSSGSDTWIDRLGRLFDITFGRQIGRPLRRMEMAFRRLLQLPQQAMQYGGRMLGGIGGRVLDRFFPSGNSGNSGRPGEEGKGRSHRAYKLIAIRQRNRMIRLLHKIAGMGGGKNDNVIEGVFRKASQRNLPNAQRRITQSGTGTTVANRGATAAAGATGAGRARATATAVGRLASNPVGAVVAAIIAAIAAVALGLYGLAKVFKHNERELASVSPQISAALAEREFGRTRQRVERNERIGEQTAAMTKTWTRFEEAQYELWTAIYELLIPFGPILEAVIDFLTAIVQSFKAMIRLLMIAVQVADEIYQVLTVYTQGELVQGGVVDAIQDYQNAIQDATRAWVEVMTTNSGRGQSNTNNFGPNPFSNQSAPPRPNLFNPGLPRGRGRII